MAGVKGRSGGARPGSGPKPRLPIKHISEIADLVVEQSAPVAGEGAGVSQPTQPMPADISPLDFLLFVMRNPGVDDKLRLDAAKTAAQYLHMKKGDGGIKDEKAEKAKKAAAGKFGAAAPPKLVAVSGR